MKYAVAVANLFDNDNTIQIVEAENEVEAIKKAYIQFSKYKDDAIEWMNDPLVKEINNVEKLRIEIFSSDTLISKPEII